MEPNPKQALALWRMLTAETPEFAEPKLSDVKPALSVDERAALIRGGFLETRPGLKRATHLVATEKAWAWAGRTASVSLLKSRSTVGAEVLEALLHRVLSFLHREEIPLANVLHQSPAVAREEPVSSTPAPVPANRGAMSSEVPRDQVLDTIRSLASSAPAGAVRMTALRSQLVSLNRGVVDQALRALRDARLIILYQDDDRASLTQADHDAALIEADTPRHLVYLENR